MEFNPGFDIIPTVNPMGFKYGADVFGPQVENRYLRDIRGGLRRQPETVCSRQSFQSVVRS